jgi:hypothetical protein
MARTGRDHFRRGLTVVLVAQYRDRGLVKQIGEPEAESRKPEAEVSSSTARGRRRVRSRGGGVD